MKRREFLSFLVGLVAGSMIKPVEPVVRIPTRPRVYPTETPPQQVLFGGPHKLLIRVDGEWREMDANPIWTTESQYWVTDGAIPALTWGFNHG